MYSIFQEEAKSDWGSLKVSEDLKKKLVSLRENIILTNTDFCLKPSFWSYDSFSSLSS